jgi:hypothetical protein
MRDGLQRSGLYLVATTALLSMAACGASGTKHSSSTTAVHTASTTLPTAPALALAQQACPADVLPGYSPSSPGPGVASNPVTATDPSGWAADRRFPPAQQAAEVTTLRQNGFIRGVFEDLQPTTGNDPNGEAICVVEQFGTGSGAATQLRHEIQQANQPSAGGTFTAFAVSGIPGAFGFDAGSNNIVGHNIVFGFGPYVVTVGVGYSQTTTPAPTRELLMGAAAKIYARLKSAG